MYDRVTPKDVWSRYSELRESGTAASGCPWARLPDVVFLTDEDPRKENPSQILTELQMGIESEQTSTRIVRIHDRRCAIQSALDLCNRPEDVLLLLGKGHESSIQYADGPQPWNERKVVEELLAQRSPANA